MTLGDVLAAVAIVFSTAFALFCCMVLSALLFPVRTARAATDLVQHPWKCGTTGLFVGLPVVLFGLVLFNVAHPVARIAGLFVVTAALVLVAAGSGGLARLVGARVSQDSNLDSSIVQVSSGAFLVVGSTLLPLVGWLFLGPLFTICALGAGVRSMKEPSKITITTVQSQEVP